MSLRTDLSELALDFGDAMLERAKKVAQDEGEILKWGAEHCKVASEMWADGSVSDSVFEDWLRTITLNRVPTKTAALLKYEAKQATALFVSNIFNALFILAGAGK